VLCCAYDLCSAQVDHVVSDQASCILHYDRRTYFFSSIINLDYASAGWWWTSSLTIFIMPQLMETSIGTYVKSVVNLTMMAWFILVETQTFMSLLCMYLYLCQLVPHAVMCCLRRNKKYSQYCSRRLMLGIMWFVPSFHKFGNILHSAHFDATVFI